MDSLKEEPVNVDLSKQEDINPLPTPSSTKSIKFGKESSIERNLFPLIIDKPEEAFNCAGVN